MGLRDSDEGLRRRFREAGLEILCAHARIDHDGDGPGLEQSEGQHEKFHARSDHENRSRPRCYAKAFESTSDAVALVVKLLGSDPRVGVVSGAVAFALDHDSQRIRLTLRHLGEVGCDIHGGCLHG